MLKKAKQFAGEALSEDVHGPRVARSVSVFLGVLILLNVIAVVLESVQELADAYGKWFEVFEWFSVSIFATEYLLRLYLVKANAVRWARLRWMIRPLSFIDLLAILPFFLPVLVSIDLRVLRGLRLLRLLRVAKIARYSSALRALGAVFKSKGPELAVSGMIAILLLTMSASVMYFFEREAQPKVFSSIPASMWWAVVTLTTVGYGDVYPITAGGKLFGAVVAVLGIGVVALPAGILGSGFVSHMDDLKKAKPSAFKCPHCGETSEDNRNNAA